MHAKVKGARSPNLVAYLSAAEAIRQRGEQVTTASLACQLKKSKRAIQATLGRYPHRKSRLGLLTQAQAGRLKQERLYADTIQTLFRKRIKISKAAIARMLGINKSTVSKNIKKMPDLQAFLKE